jgi:hypothetical protein
MTKIPKKIYNNKWIHSFEEDTDDLKIYRTEDFDFPLSRRVREAFELSPNGELYYYEPGPTDRASKLTGTYKIQDPKEIKADLRNQEFIINFASLKQNILKMKSSKV